MTLAAWVTGVAVALVLWAAPPALQAAPATDACPPQPKPLTADDVQRGMQDAIDRGFLWRVSKGGKTSWLYGTLHVARKPWMFPGPQVRNALQSVDRVALELDMLDPDIQRRLMTVLAAAPGQPVISGPLQRRLRAQMDKACAGQELAALKPEMQAVTLTVMAGRRAGLEPAYGIDGFLAGYARGLHKPVLSLETPEAQIGLLLQPTPAETETFVGHALDELDSGHALPTLQRLAEAWARSDWAELSSYADWCRCVDSDDDKRLMRRLIDERNVTMAAQLQTRHDAGERLFVAVGALHLIGEQGVPALLKSHGFDVQRIEGGLPAAAASAASR
ncbi:MAG TPA: TraB/GumN family protein [Ideonella sp.]|uniref:TraB/GumN family protein n=1 Tax=Ideonella sp. TaxID=1929293 RepID=UPI002E31B5D7|nr:TraB/GumN family protein [Ideonella sp.]HEX5682521.1 TraB/GumN family protein [Ideonella sp.]